MRSRWAVPGLTAFFAVSPLAAAGQGVPGYVIGDHALLPDSLAESYHGGRFTIEVVRTVADSVDREALLLAESLLPTESVIEAVVDSTLSEMRHKGLWPRNFARARERGGPRWWWLEWEHAWLPFAITAPGVAEYIERMRGLAESHPNDTANDRGIFSYEALVRAIEGGGRMVTMSVTWDFGAMHFEHRREVTFDRDNNPVAVVGDGPPEWATVRYRRPG